MTEHDPGSAPAPIEPAAATEPAPPRGGGGSPAVPVWLLRIGALGWRILAVLALALCARAAAPAQDELPSSPALERAIVVEELEHDRRQALALYAALAEDAALADDLRRPRNRFL